VETRADSQSLAVRSTTWLESAAWPIEISDDDDDDDNDDEDSDEDDDDDDDSDVMPILDHDASRSWPEPRPVVARKRR